MHFDANRQALAVRPAPLIKSQTVPFFGKTLQVRCNMRKISFCWGKNWWVFLLIRRPDNPSQIEIPQTNFLETLSFCWSLEKILVGMALGCRGLNL